MKKKMTKSRLEHDSLGQVELPHDAMYGAQTQRALTNFPISGQTARPSLIRAYLRLKSAAAHANFRCGVISRSQERLIRRAIDEIIGMPETEWPRLFPVDAYQAGAGTSQNMNVNEVVANFANRIAGTKAGSNSPIHPNDHVNRSQSTNDSYPTALRLALLESSQSLVVEVNAIAKAFRKKAGQWRDLPKSARTHLQDAVPMRLGQEIGAYATVLERCGEWIAQARDELRELGIGGSAAGTGLTVPKGFIQALLPELTRLTGEKLTSAPDLCESMQSQAPILYYSSMLRVLAAQLTRICNDLRLLSSGPLTGLAELTLPSVQPGSSIMPGKVNPSILEMVNQACFSILGHDHAVTMAVQAGQLELNVMMPLMAFSTLEATTVATNSLLTMRMKAIEGLVANEERLRHYFESTPQIATALSPKLGYEVTAALVSEAIASHRSIAALVREKGLIPDRELRAILDSRTLTGAANGSRRRT